MLVAGELGVIVCENKITVLESTRGVQSSPAVATRTDHVKHVRETEGHAAVRGLFADRATADR